MQNPIYPYVPSKQSAASFPALRQSESAVQPGWEAALPAWPLHVVCSCELSRPHTHKSLLCVGSSPNPTCHLLSMHGELYKDYPLFWLPCSLIVGGPQASDEPWLASLFCKGLTARDSHHVMRSPYHSTRTGRARVSRNPRVNSPGMSYSAAVPCLGPQQWESLPTMQPAAGMR